MIRTTEAATKKLREAAGLLADAGLGIEQTQEEAARGFVDAVLAAHDGNQTAAARAAGIHRNTLARIIARTQPKPTTQSQAE